MAIDEDIDRLYGLPLAEFTRARDEAARALRKAGQREAAERLKAARKPTTAAGAVNRLVREHRDEVERFLHAAAELRDAQVSGKGDLAEAMKQEHRALEPLIAIGGEAVRQSFLAAAVDDDAARQLLEAQLVQELEPRGFGTLLAHAPPMPPRLPSVSRVQADEAPMARKADEESHDAAPSAAAAGVPEAETQPSRPERKKPDDRAARAKLRDAKAALSTAEAEERSARRRWDRAQRDLEKVQAALERSRREAEGAQGELQTAQASVEEARTVVDAAQRDLDVLRESQAE